LIQRTQPLLPEYLKAILGEQGLLPQTKARNQGDERYSHLFFHLKILAPALKLLRAY
jgi:hypothetical protein